ncbi:unnamed protein product [Paramecium sonneborni]|uniref:Uncharacterized protein n=1 Tax=Paramecium sonneborni TaxID=65129 RepID=A0A8S1KVP9_9CILI|nr:unnamed protein product [Paramecium sonneborni]
MREIMDFQSNSFELLECGYGVFKIKNEYIIDHSQLWSNGYFCNSYILVDEKMAKQIGTFKIIQDMVRIYDVTIFGIAEAEDINYELKLADSAILKQSTLEIISNYNTQAQYKIIDIFDDIFKSLNKLFSYSLKLRGNEIRDVIKNGFHFLLEYKDDFLQALQSEGPYMNFILKYIKIQNTSSYN